jgi:hypothetical protein
MAEQVLPRELNEIDAMIARDAPTMRILTDAERDYLLHSKRCDYPDRIFGRLATMSSNIRKRVEAVCLSEIVFAHTDDEVRQEMA